MPKIEKISAKLTILIALILVIAAIAYYFKDYVGSRHDAQQAQSQAAVLDELYDNKDSRYSIRYPATWEYDASKRGTVVFSGKPDEVTYLSNVNIQVVLTKQRGGKYVSVNDFVSSIKNQIKKHMEKGKLVQSGTITFTLADGAKVEGEYLIFTYHYKGITFKQWQIILLRSSEDVFYTWAYTSPIEQYQQALAIAMAMLKSWSIY